MGDVISLQSHYNNKYMQSTIDKRVTNSDDSFEADIVFNNGISPVNKANYIRRLFDWNPKKMPFPIVQFANSLGVEVFVEDLSELDEDSSLKGYLAIKPNGQAVIVVSEEESYGHQRWTVAHELWHYFMNRDVPRKNTSIFAEHGDYDSAPSNKEEREADLFATSLLMPEREFKAIYRAYSSDDKRKAKKFLMDYFAVSLTAVNRRIKALNL